MWDEFTLESINEVCGELLDNPQTLAHGKGPIPKAADELQGIISRTLAPEGGYNLGVNFLILHKWLLALMERTIPDSLATLSLKLDGPFCPRDNPELSKRRPPGNYPPFIYGYLPKKHPSGRKRTFIVTHAQLVAVHFSNSRFYKRDFHAKIARIPYTNTGPNQLTPELALWVLCMLGATSFAQDVPRMDIFNCLQPAAGPDDEQAAEQS